MSLIPAVLNARARHASAAREALTSAGGFEVREVLPLQLAEEARRVVMQGAPRVVVAGGDGSVGTVANTVRHGVEIGVVPCGTLNHLARDLGLPPDLSSAVHVAKTGLAIPVDAGTVNSQLFLNTSAVGASVSFIRTRDRIEPALGYHLSSLAAAVRLLVHLPVFPVTLQVEGITRRYLTPLVIVAIGERDFKLPLLGARMPGGRAGLHVLVVRRRSGARTLALALAAAARGVGAMKQTPAMDAFLTDECEIELPAHRIALDGEILRIRAPLAYRHLAGHLRIVIDSRKLARGDGGTH